MLEQLRGSGRRFAAVSVVAVAVIATAVSVTIWRYEAALSRSSVALDARSDAALTATLSSDFWHEHEAINEYFLAPSPAILAAVSAQRRQFAATSAVLGATQNAAETRFREQATSANNAFIATLTRLKGAAGTTSARELAAIAQLRANEASVLRPLTELAHAQAQRAQTAQAAAVSAASQARWIGVAAAILAVLTGLAFSIYTLRLLGRAHREPEISLVITDLVMPELDGIELTKAIRSGTAYSALPVVIVTSRGSEDDRLKGIAAGADAYMVKQSFDQHVLLATVERLVGR